MVDPVIWTGSMRNWVLSYFCNGSYQTRDCFPRSLSEKDAIRHNAHD